MMPCFHPMKANRRVDGKMEILPQSAVLFMMKLPCGQCIGCRLERSRQWAMRCVHEAKLHEQNCFITLTYSPEHLPVNGSLDYSHFQKFMKRFRKVVPQRVRYYMCGEYGENYQRPHFHAILFGYDFEDKKPWKTTSSKSIIYRSDLLERLWPFGYSSIGTVTFESAAYCARYCVKKITGSLADKAYTRVNVDTGEIIKLTPEFNHMSLKPLEKGKAGGIGGEFFERFRRDMYPRDYVIIDGTPCKPPKYYDKLFKRFDANEFDNLIHRRTVQANERWQDNTKSRLSAKEQCAQARLNQLKRGFNDG